MLVLSGTNRPQSNTRKVAGRVFNLLNQKLGNSQAQMLDLVDLKHEIFDSSSYAKKPDWFIKNFQEPILASPGMLVVTPEYNGSFPGVLKYFIDMLKFPESIVGMKIGFIGVAAGQFGALRSVEQLELIFHYRRAHIFGERLFIPMVNQFQSPADSLGEHDERLERLVEGFITFMQGSQNGAVGATGKK